MTALGVIEDRPPAAAPAAVLDVERTTNRSSGNAGGVASYALPMRTLTHVVTIATERHLQFVDVTERVLQLLAESGIQNGFAVVFSRHTTAGIRINEHEPLLLEDMARLLETIVPAEASYRH